MKQIMVNNFKQPEKQQKKTCGVIFRFVLCCVATFRLQDVGVCKGDQLQPGIEEKKGVHISI